MVSLSQCKAQCHADAECVFVDYDPSSGCFHSKHCQATTEFENAKIFYFKCSSAPDCDVNQMQTLRTDGM